MEVLAERRETGPRTFLPLESMVDFSPTSLGSFVLFDSSEPAVLVEVVKSAAPSGGSLVVFGVVDFGVVAVAFVDKKAISSESGFAPEPSPFCVVEEFCKFFGFARR